MLANQALYDTKKPGEAIHPHGDSHLYEGIDKRIAENTLGLALKCYAILLSFIAFRETKGNEI